LDQDKQGGDIWCLGHGDEPCRSEPSFLNGGKVGKKVGVCSACVA
jgi:hypothetical protein